MMSRSSIQVPYFGEEIYRRKVARLPMNMPKVELRSASAAIYYLFFKAESAALNELLFYKSLLSSLISRCHCLYKTVGKATEILVKYIS
jgi:hypothetical protein